MLSVLPSQVVSALPSQMVTALPSLVVSELPNPVVSAQQYQEVPEFCHFYLSAMTTACLCVWAAYKSAVPHEVAMIVPSPSEMGENDLNSVIPVIPGVSIITKDDIPSSIISARENVSQSLDLAKRVDSKLSACSVTTNEVVPETPRRPLQS